MKSNAFGATRSSTIPLAESADLTVGLTAVTQSAGTESRTDVEVNMNDVELAVLQAIKGRYGKGRAVSRDQLKMDVNLFCDREEGDEVGDRAVREAIEVLRQTHPTGARIMSSSGWAGYWLAESPEEFDALYQEQRNRALSRIAKATRPFEKPFSGGGSRTAITHVCMKGCSHDHTRRD
jgi:hypothetical protein